jgi:glycosyltransferase involved in cell wall biosynthesis
MPRSPTISVLVPTFNDERFIGVAIESILAQSFPDFEVVVSDDASSDQTAEIACSFAARDFRVKYFRNESNLGMTGNWNAALARASGQYVMKLDADDAFAPHTLQRLFDAMQLPDQPFAAFCRTLTCDETLAAVSSHYGERAFVKAGIEPLQDHVKRGHDWYQFCFDDYQLWHSNAHILERETFLRIGGWDAALGCASDTDLVLRILEQNEPVAHVGYAGGLYRIRPDSVSARYRRQAWLRWESAVIHLRSLARMRAKGARISSHVQRQWWRIWRNFVLLSESKETAFDTLPRDARDQLLTRVKEVSSPPIAVALRGFFRQTAHNALRSVRAR